MQLKNKTILITGGSSGIGLAAIEPFLQQGMKVIVCGKNTEKNNFVRSQYPSVTVIDCDIKDEGEVDVMYHLITATGGIDILYNNAAVINVLDMTQKGTEMVACAADEIQTNYLAVVRLNSLFMPLLQSRAEAAIINTTSAVAYVPIHFIPTYSSSKAALQSYTISLRYQLQKMNSSIKVFELIPPTVDTAVTKNFNGPKISTEKVVTTLIKGLKNNTFTIRVSMVKTLYGLHRFLPGLAYKLLNRK
jgi:uncharacterized oxidoreductase